MMKNIAFLCIVPFLLIGCASAQNKPNNIDQKLDAKKGKEIVLVKIVNDSRCPEGVQCIWAGEITFEVAAYEDNKLVEQTLLTLTPNKENTVLDWFEKHLPKSDQKLKEIGITPYPKNGVTVKPEAYSINLIY